MSLSEKKGWGFAMTGVIKTLPSIRNGAFCQNS